MKPKPSETVRVVSTLFTHLHNELPELPGGQVVELPADKARIALSLEGVVLASPTTPQDKE